MIMRKRMKCEKFIRGVIITLFLTLVISFPSAGNTQQKYPTRPITFVMGYAPGGNSDITGRALADAASKILGQPVLVVNKPGGSTALSLTNLKNEKPDGYNIGIMATGGIVAQHLRKVAYDTDKDFSLIIQHANFQEGLVVRADSPWKSLREFIDYARSNPGKIRYSTSGPGSPSYLEMEQLSIAANIKMQHVPFEGSGPSIAALLGGHVDAICDNTAFKPHVVQGRLRVLAAVHEKRLPFAPDVPTLQEAGYNVMQFSVLGVCGPKGLPKEIVNTLHNAFKMALEDPDYLKVVAMVDAIVIYRSPEELAKHIATMNNSIERLVVNLGLRKD
jgi:tripartite-type tricarboxylate transporter receptor subunit TctC